MVLLAVAILPIGWPLVLRAQNHLTAQSKSDAPMQSNARHTIPAGGASPLPAYTIAPGDLLDIYVVAVPELSRNYRVSPAGHITLPMLDHPIQAQGLTPDQLSETIARRLRRQGLITHPDVLVSVDSSPGNSIVVTGSVSKPGVYPAYGPTRIVAILSRAGGLSPDAGSTAVVMRGAKAMHWLESLDTDGATKHPARPPRIVKVPIRHLLDTGDEGQNLALYPGDEVDVPRAGVVYVVGAVHRAGGFALTGEAGRLTVLQAIALAGNVTRTAMLKDALIIREERGHQERVRQERGRQKPDWRAPGQSTRREQIHVNLKAILAGKKTDRWLGAGDILFVPDSTGKQVLARALAAATSVAVYRAPL